MLRKKIYRWIARERERKIKKSDRELCEKKRKREREIEEKKERKKCCCTHFGISIGILYSEPILILQVFGFMVGGFTG